jgi:hypothetical protein
VTLLVSVPCSHISDLTVYRQATIGTAQRPFYCPLIELASVLLPTSEIHLLTRILLADKVMAGSDQEWNQRKQVRQKQARVYQLLRESISNPATDLSHALMDLLQVIWFELFIGQRAIATRRVEQLDEYIIGRGGLGSITALSLPSDIRSMMPRFYLSIYLLLEPPHMSRLALTNVYARFIKTLEQISAWVRRAQNAVLDDRHPTSLILDSAARMKNKNLLRPLTSYLDCLIEKQVRADPSQSFSVAHSAYYCCYNLCMTFVEHALDATGALHFLTDLQARMWTSTRLGSSHGHELESVHIMVTSHLLALTRRSLYSTNSDAQWPSLSEMRIYESILDAQRLAPYIPGYLKAHITRMLCRAVLVGTDLVEDDARVESIIDEDFLAKIKFAWERREDASRAPSQ